MHLRNNKEVTLTEPPIACGIPNGAAAWQGR
jgi:hypothetical protein